MQQLGDGRQRSQDNEARIPIFWRKKGSKKEVDKSILAVRWRKQQKGKEI